MDYLRTLAVTAVMASTTLSAVGAAGAADIQLLVNGLASPNLATPPDTQSFADWCEEACFPTTHQTVQDPRTGRRAGEIYVWAKNFVTVPGGSLCFSEFIVFALGQGEIHVASGDNGTCGAPIDPALKPPLYADLGAEVVIAGGGDGLIVEGTGGFALWTGTYTDRVFVGFGQPESGVGGIVYYDQLWFSISRTR